MFIEGKQINLRQLKKTDDESVFKQANNRLVSRYTTVPYPYTLEIAQSFIKDTAKKIKAGISYDLAIVTKDNDEVIGMIALRIVKKEIGLAEFGYWLGSKYWGKGIVSEAAGLMLDFGFKKLKLKKIFAKVMKPNIGSVRILEKNRFKLEGDLRRHDCKMGKFYDVLIFGLLKEEYKKNEA
jgi:[ribosomal protein S5]-alanine N-acetyltransferase